MAPKSQLHVICTSLPETTCSIRASLVAGRVLIDGKPPGAAHGADIDADGNGTAVDQRLYQLIRQPGPIADREFEIQFLDPGVEAFAFTFG